MSYTDDLLEMVPEVKRMILNGDENQLRWLFQWAYDQGKMRGEIDATNAFLDAFRAGWNRNIEQGAENAGEGADLGQVGQ